MSFQGKSAIVTGGARGIGRAIAIALAKQGCNIAFNYAKSADAANQLVEEIQSLGVRALASQTDVANHEAAKDMVAQVKEQLGGIDYLVNNAGITKDKLLMMMSEDDWDAVLDTNLKGVFNMSKPVATLMLKKRAGSILNITSISGVVGMAGQTNYSSSKAGMIGFTKALAKEIASRGITVNALALGFIDTDMTTVLPDEYKTKMLDMVPLKRFGTVEDVTNVALFLLSDAAKYITGQVIQVDGGLAM
ncbi:MAG TPA: 3-oxoacyl-[acyl-carrier-protein] reductase [Blastocatellia bacterium]|nr:3-oxoacyl-[acyl-carrier-protein] reductase [Blastocatellia bacterium]